MKPAGFEDLSSQRTRKQEIDLFFYQIASTNPVRYQMNSTFGVMPAGYFQSC